MKTSNVFSTTKRFQTNRSIATSLLIAFVLLVVTNPSNLLGQDPGPGITIRFANPEYDFNAETYCVDVEFKSAIDGVEVSGINTRFFFDDNLLEFLGFTDFQGGYGRADDAEPVFVDNKGNGAFFAFQGEALFINEAIEKLDSDADPILLSTTEWKSLFKACFAIKDEDFLEVDEFCPSMVWDMQSNPNDKSFLAGSEGVVITVASENGCILAAEEVEQFNWSYDGAGGIYGGPETDPDKRDCISTRSIPIPSWALAMAAMLMMVFVVVRKRLGFFQP